MQPFTPVDHRQLCASLSLAPGGLVLLATAAVAHTD